MVRETTESMKLDCPAMCSASPSNGKVTGDATTPLSSSNGRNLGGMTPLSCGFMKSGKARRSAIRDYPECLLRSLKDNHSHDASLNKLKTSMNAPPNPRDIGDKSISCEPGNLSDKFNKVSLEPEKATSEHDERLHQPENTSEDPQKCSHEPEVSAKSSPENLAIKVVNPVQQPENTSEDPQKCSHEPEVSAKRNPENLAIKVANPAYRRKKVVRDFPDIRPKPKNINPSQAIVVSEYTTTCPETVAIGDTDAAEGIKMQISTVAIQRDSPSTEVYHKRSQDGHVEKMSPNLDLVAMEAHMGPSSTAVPAKDIDEVNIQKTVSLTKRENPHYVKGEITSPSSEQNQHISQKLLLGNVGKQPQQIKRKSGTRDLSEIVKQPKPMHANVRVDKGKIVRPTEIQLNSMDNEKRDNMKCVTTTKSCETTPPLKPIGSEGANLMNNDIYSSKRKSPEETDDTRSKKIGKSKHPDCVMPGREAGFNSPAALGAQEISPNMSNQIIKVSPSSDSSKNNRQSTAIIVALKPMDKARKMIIESLKLFDSLWRKLTQDEEKNGKQDKNFRSHNQAANMIKEHASVRSEKVKGSIPGFDVGTIFFFRSEMSSLRFHGPIQGGIEYLTAKETSWNAPVAISIISNVGQDGEDDGDQLIYNGQGGRGPDNKSFKDQKLERGNLAMDGSKKFNVPVRLTRGVMDPNSPSGRVYVYDGLYAVVDTFTVKSEVGFDEYKFKLMRLPDQPPIPSNQLELANRLRKLQPSERNGVILSDISKGREQHPVCVENTVDDDRAINPFEYITKVRYPSSIQKFDLPMGCICKGVCTASDDCKCFLANGGELPFVNGGLLVREKDYIFECGNQCSCPSNCKNRVIENGMKYRLEVFKTFDRGWGVRALDLLPAGSFVCEYAGRMVVDPEMMKISSRKQYALDLRRVPVKRSKWGDVTAFFPDGTPSDILPHCGNPDTVIDASTQGNVARFINHACSPNLLMQKVLAEHHDPRFPRIAFFAMENILPLTELTFDYGPPSDEDESIICLCGSSECRGRI